jgi:type II secretory pathway pseudopilin PulG
MPYSDEGEQLYFQKGKKTMKCWYRKQMKGMLSEEEGMTLVEVLASILLLSLIITTFLSFFIQAAKINNQTDTVNEATFIAQEQIELLTYYSETETVEETLKLIKTERSSTNSGFQTQTEVFKKSGETLYTGTVTVSKKGKAYAQMETRLSFRTAEDLED